MVTILIHEEGGYPKPDICKYCGEHLGIIMQIMGETVALGCCDKKECQDKKEEEDEDAINS